MINSLAADINPIGGISKTDLKKFVAYSKDAFNLPVLTEYVYWDYCIYKILTFDQVHWGRTDGRAWADHRNICSIGWGQYIGLVHSPIKLNEDIQADMGMTYDELSVFGRLRKVEKCGPYSTYTKLLREWGHRLSPIQVCRDLPTYHYFFHTLHRLQRRWTYSSLNTLGIEIKGRR